MMDDADASFTHEIATDSIFCSCLFFYTLLQEIYSRLRKPFVKVKRPLLVEDCASSDDQTMLPSAMLLL